MTLGIAIRASMIADVSQKSGINVHVYGLYLQLVREGNGLL